jgi:hypothetical protein
METELRGRFYGTYTLACCFRVFDDSDSSADLRNAAANCWITFGGLVKMVGRLNSNA